MNRPLSIAALIPLACCGVSASPGGNSCTITVSGAVTASVTQSCIPSAAVSGGTAGFGLTVTDPTYGQLAFVGTFKGSTFATGTYDGTSLAEGATTLTDPAGSRTLWEETSASAGSAATGTLKLVISSTGTQIAGGTATAWAGSHGALDATLPPAPGNTSTASVTVHVAF